METSEMCPLCDRELGENKSRHHLVPRSYKGKLVVVIHKICHDKIHSLFTEKELAKQYNTIEKLKQHEEIQKFINWVKNKDIYFYQTHRDSRIRKSKR